MRTPRRLVAAVAAAALGWGTLSLVVTAPADASAGVQAGKHKRDAPHDPATYYAGTEGLSGSALATALNAIIDGNTQLTYAQVYDALPFTDEDPNNTANLIVFYSGTSLLKTSRCGGGSCAGQWNREHTWPQSHGDLTTGVGPGTDLFHMRPEFADTNSSRSNKDFDNGGTSTVPSCAPCHSTANTFEPRAAVKGDLARGLMYMDVRFNGDATDGSYTQDLVLGENVPTSGPHIGKLSTLVAWSQADPPDAGELARNNMIDGTYQHNRNPFIDHPEWVCSIWGSSVPAGTCAANTAPTTSPMTKTTAEDTATTVALTATDPENDPLTWSVTTAPTHGSAGIVGSTLTYTPAANYNGTDVVGVTVNDGHGHAVATTVTITVTPVNDAPTATAQTTATNQNTAKVITLAGADVDGDTLTYAIATAPTHGTVDLTGNQATYTPTTDYVGPDSFTFTVNDGTVSSAPATVSINVSASNHAPTATPQSVTTPEETPKVITLAGADTDGDTLSYAIGTGPAHGTLNLVGTQATYTPAANYNGPDSFTFTVNDGAVTSAPATVSITVTPVNDAPTATDQSVTVDEDSVKVITLAGTDVDGDTLTFAKASNPAHGTVTITSAGQATYTPTANYNGPDSFTFTVNDGTVTSAAATVSITVVEVNDAPTATAASVTTAEDTAKVITLAGTDVDGDTLAYAIGATPGHGVVTLSGNEATYTPATDYHGPDSFTFTVNDGTVTSAPATVTINVTPVNDKPLASGVTVATAEGQPVTIDLVGSDVDGDTLTYAKATDPAHGTLGPVTGNQVTYTPTAAYHGSDSFTFTVSDGTLTSTPGTVDISVDAINHAPSLDDVALSTTAGTPVSTTLAPTDPDSDPVTIQSITTPAHGTVTSSGLTVTYTPTTRSGTETFSVTVTDGHGGTDTALVTVTIAARTATLSLSTPPATRGKPVTTTITATGPAGANPSGLVTLKNGATTLGTATLKADGTATVPWTPTLAGPRTLTATYAGDALFDPATSPTSSVTVARSASAFAFNGRLKKGKAGKVKVRVTTVSGVAATGKVTLKVGKKKFTATLKHGVAKFKIGTVPNKAKLKVKAKYAGDAQYAAGSGKRTYVLK